MFLLMSAISFYSHSGGQWLPFIAGRLSLPDRDADLADRALRLGTVKIDGKQAVAQFRGDDAHTVGQDEAALEPSRRDAAMQIFPRLVFRLVPADDQLVLLDRYIEIGF